jgi:general secretion pathway protein G
MQPRSLPIHRTAPTRGAGFTLIELMVVLLVLVLLASIAAPRVTHYLQKAKIEAAKVQVEALSAAVDSFHLDMGRFPSSGEGLKALLERPSDGEKWDGPYVRKRDSLTDPWGRAYRYRFPGEHGDYDVFTLGANESEGGSDGSKQIGNW